MTGVLAVRRLRLSHFRSHQVSDLELDGRPVAVFGANGSGKTNLLEAVSLLSPGRGLRRAAVEEMARAPERIGWKVSAEVETSGEIRQVETASTGSGRQVQIDGKTVAQSDLGRIIKVLWLVPAMDRLWTEGATGRRRFLDRITLSLFPEHAAVSIGYEKALRERNRLLKDGVSDPAWYRALETQMAAFGQKLSKNRNLALECLRRETIAGEFPAIDLHLASREAWSETGLIDLLAEGRRRDRVAGRSLTGPHRDELEAVYVEKSMPAALCSTGEQKAFLISVVLANAQAVTARFGAPPLLLLDEVSAHLDADRRAALYDVICGMGAQAWMTGTERNLFAGLGERAAFLTVFSEAGKSVILAQ